MQPFHQMLCRIMILLQRQSLDPRVVMWGFNPEVVCEDIGLHEHGSISPISSF